METNIQIFKNSQFGEVRVTEIDGKTYFVGIDVTRALGYKNVNDAVTRHCKGCVKHAVLDNNGVAQTMNVIPEGDIYRLAAKSELPGAEAFESWIFDEVLPSIRKHGGYLTPAKTEELLMNPDLIIQMATSLKEERQKRLKAETVIEEQAPKVKFYEDVMSSDNLMSITEIAKNYGWSGVSLNGILHGAGVQYKKGRHWFITAQYQNKDYVRFIPVYQYEKNGVQIVRSEMKWTETGRKFIHELLVENGLINRQKSLML
jgi:prophage antirepressor-like protein